MKGTEQNSVRNFINTINTLGAQQEGGNHSGPRLHGLKGLNHSVHRAALGYSDYCLLHRIPTQTKTKIWQTYSEEMANQGQVRTAVLWLHKLPKLLLCQLYRSTTESILFSSANIWFSSATQLEKLQKGCKASSVPSLQYLYTSRVRKWVGRSIRTPHTPHIACPDSNPLAGATD